MLRNDREMKILLAASKALIMKVAEVVALKWRVRTERENNTNIYSSPFLTLQSLSKLTYILF